MTLITWERKIFQLFIIIRNYYHCYSHVHINHAKMMVHRNTTDQKLYLPFIRDGIGSENNTQAASFVVISDPQYHFRS